LPATKISFIDNASSALKKLAGQTVIVPGEPVAQGRVQSGYNALVLYRKQARF
jgi:hypothetical protein